MKKPENLIIPESREIDFSNLPPINQRPADMSQEDYRIYRKAYNLLLKQYKRHGRVLKGVSVAPLESGTKN